MKSGINYWITVGLTLLIIGAGLTFSWIYSAPLSSAAIAPGQLIVEGKRKKIQHLEGGIIEEIHVKEGDLVEKGSQLVTLNSTRAKTQYLQVRSRYLNALAKYNRLQSEVKEQRHIEYHSDLLVDDILAQQAVDTQTKLMQIRLESLDGLTNVAEKRMQQAKQNLTSYLSRAKTDRKAMALLDEQVNMLSKLSKQGYASKDQLLYSQRERLDMQRSIDDYDSAIQRQDLIIAEAAQTITNIRLEFIKEASEELEEAEHDVIELKEREQQAIEELARTKVASPINGKVVELHVNTLGGIVDSGEVIVEIVPVDGELIVEASVDPTDIDTLAIGQTAEIRLTSYNYRRTLPLKGEVVYISADSILNEKDDTSSYTINVKIDAQTLEQDHPVKLYPGMPAEVLILLDKRTVADYLLNPILISLNRSFRDSDY
ncbi:HlyD family type I secretion periplasmic adaptor subunit [Vibrio agarivorans]|uniref:HlyD family type I secretion periplasmic adaptor subunit n=1 Tax=Vibrio agarivorans TaxID=153622 RepID=UPI0025B4E1A6|nr:HlyD family type I secretion periplasmic adaptor subunit [Vibrio agarivorans]MDN3660809.1 HlyD family type I secretion periplasmic adaptor subunit [Vibrio agarivorans]